MRRSRTVIGRLSKNWKGFRRQAGVVLRDRRRSAPGRLPEVQAVTTSVDRTEGIADEDPQRTPWRTTHAGVGTRR